MNATVADGGRPSGSARVVEDGFVAELVLENGPLNLVTRPLLRAFNRILADLARRQDVRCVIVHGGAAKAFCAGSDIKEFGPVRHDASEQKILFEDMVLRNLARLPMPTIAAIDGPALGGGLEIALSCDIRILRDGVRIGLPECQLGGLAGSGSVRLSRLIGPSRAKQMLFTGEPISSDQALAWGVVNEIARDGSALAAARLMAATICKRGPISNRLAKELADMAGDLPLDAGLLHSTVSQQRIFDSDDLQEGAAAFFGKRAPTFVGR
ncbi:enoyl-CoA hydratase-related protein [Bosea sp. (in: a-proteobacteria)]|uniref:enoyl-CoA hydratase/isomerase family protein n=1 Tax=Bosea sp. (in: a-proteobacteria) TaxID=1871050 RepID=UPI00261E30CC|nr:enoyl-CoA hydratase-related protein [Bosea sp. (in: a-proteobacteria)]MCO5090345.1 enoyl-CoA hydratase-related protein [Bosea sp. (in: a-proteobacteria)]